MVVNGHRDHLFCLLLADHILVQLFLYGMGGRDILQLKKLLFLALFLFLHPFFPSDGVEIDLADGDPKAHISPGKASLVRRFVLLPGVRIFHRLGLLRHILRRSRRFWSCLLFFSVLWKPASGLVLRLLFPSVSSTGASSLPGDILPHSHGHSGVPQLFRRDPGQTAHIKPAVHDCIKGLLHTVPADIDAAGQRDHLSSLALRSPADVADLIVFVPVVSIYVFFSLVQFFSPSCESLICQKTIIRYFHWLCKRGEEECIISLLYS
ncbi:unknown [Clostridium sp. CAG:58]|nr:unknown [Clostridium sp. CAG:58]